MRHLSMQFRGDYDGAGLMVGLNYLEGLFQPGKSAILFTILTCVKPFKKKNNQREDEQIQSCLCKK